MRTSHPTTIALTLTAAFAIFSAGSLQADPIAIFGTGVDAGGNVVADNTPDIHYTITSQGAATPNKRAANGAWIANDPVGNPGSAWLDGITQLNTTFTYQTTFDLTGLDPTSASLSLLLSVDNQIDAVRLNGVATGITVPFGFPAFQQLNGPFVINSGFVAGVNTLEFDALAAGGDAGFRAQITGTADAAAIPEPATLVLATVGLLGLMGTRRRRRNR